MRSLFCTLIGLLLIGLSAGFGSGTVQAQSTQVKVGPRLGLDRYGLRYFAGADAHVRISSLTLGSRQVPIVVNPFASYYFSVGGPEDLLLSALGNLSPGGTLESNGSLFQAGANALVNVSKLGAGEAEDTSFDVYIGAGLALSRISYEQKIAVRESLTGEEGSVSYEASDLVPGVNLVTSATFSGSSLGTPFVQARVTLAPRVSTNLQKSGGSALLEDYPESREYKSWGGTSFFALSVGLLLGL